MHPTGRRSFHSSVWISKLNSRSDEQKGHSREKGINLRPILAIRRRFKKHTPPPLEQAGLNIPKEAPRPPDPELLRRRELAKQTNKFNHPKIRHLYDPLRDDPAYSAIIEAAAHRAQDEVGHPHVLGTCHLIWRRQKQILKEEYGIVWYTPSEMNPQVIYD